MVRSSDAPRSVAAAEGGDGPVDSTFDTVLVARAWPARTALVVGSAMPHHVAASLERRGLTMVTTKLGDAPQVAARTGPFSLLLLDALVLTERSGSSAVQSLLDISPSARIILLGRESRLPARTLVQAMRLGATDLVDPTKPADVSRAIIEQLTMANRRRHRVLAIGAHPDDIEIGCAGTLLDHRRRGDRISMLTLSQGAVGGDRADRAREALAAADAIGAQLVLGDLVDTRIDPGIETIRMIEELVQRLDPTVVYVHSQHDNHQDHRSVHIAAMSATRGVPKVLAYQSPSANNDFAPSKFIAIDEVVTAKVEVLGLFDSQHDRSYLEPEMIIAGARYWARHLAPRARYAEPFEVIRALVQGSDRGATDRPGQPERARPARKLSSVPPIVQERSEMTA
ncbi:MAG: PIG-L family deacetylase [Jatrophihabitans sp.]